MKKKIDLIESEPSFEYFEELAVNIPKRSGDMVFLLIEIDIWNELDELPSAYPEFRILRSGKGLFSSLANAEAGIQECVVKDDADIYCFKIYELPLNSVSDFGTPDSPCAIREYLYDYKGTLIDHTLCSSIRADLDTECGYYLGRPKSQLRFKEGDIVEVIGRDTVRLAIVAHDPIDTEWCYNLYRRVSKDPKGRLFMLDASDDQVAVVDGPEYGNHFHTQLCDIMTPRFYVPDELRRLYERYLVSSRIPSSTST